MLLIVYLVRQDDPKFQKADIIPTLQRLRCNNHLNIPLPLELMLPHKCSKLKAQKEGDQYHQRLGAKDVVPTGCQPETATNIRINALTLADLTIECLQS